jgi:hypothetical protein
MTTSPHVLYEQQGFPILQNRLFASREDARSCATGDIRLVQNSSTGLVENVLFDASLIHYDSTYHNEQEYSSVFREHLLAAASIVEQRIGRHGLVEVGCGKGYFLDMLADRGLDVSGCDPAYTGSNPRIAKRFFDPATPLAARGIVLRHVLEHIPHPLAFLRQVRDANSGAGLIYIEVPCFDWIANHRAWFDVFYEHVNYFRLEDFGRIFDSVLASGRLFGGQYLYCVADLASLRDHVRTDWSAAILPPDFFKACAGVPPFGKATGKATSAIWGCASKGVIFALLRERAGHPIQVAIDLNPHKQGMHLPGTGMAVVSPAEGLASMPKGSVIYVMNSNYAEEIRELGGSEHEYICIDQTKPAGA